MVVVAIAGKNKWVKEPAHAILVLNVPYMHKAKKCPYKRKFWCTWAEQALASLRIFVDSPKPWVFYNLLSFLHNLTVKSHFYGSMLLILVLAVLKIDFSISIMFVLYYLFIFKQVKLRNIWWKLAIMTGILLDCGSGDMYMRVIWLKLLWFFLILFLDFTFRLDLNQFAQLQRLDRNWKICSVTLTVFTTTGSWIKFELRLNHI